MSVNLEMSCTVCGSVVEMLSAAHIRILIIMVLRVIFGLISFEELATALYHETSKNRRSCFITTFKKELGKVFT